MLRAQESDHKCFGTVWLTKQHSLIKWNSGVGFWRCLGGVSDVSVESQNIEACHRFGKPDKR